MLDLAVVALSLLAIIGVILTAYRTDRFENWLFPSIILLVYGVVGGVMMFPFAYAAAKYIERHRE
jgi:hypothetical protein